MRRKIREGDPPTPSPHDTLAGLSERVDRNLSDQPLVRARLKTIPGRIRTNLGHHREARAQLEEALTLCEAHLGRDRPETAETLHARGIPFSEQGDFTASQRCFRRALDLLREAVARGFAGSIIFDDPDLTRLRGDSEFERLVAVVRRRTTS